MMRTVALVVVLVGIVLVTCSGVGAVEKRTYTYKVVDDCAIEADVYVSPGDADRPAILWIHGGALMAGSRDDIGPGDLERYLNAGYVVVSIDYRLAPETKLAGIIEDVQDAYRWVREKGPDLFGIDPERIGVMGASAGGYLTLMTGFCVEPRPKALVSFFGYGDIAGPWYSRPDPFYCKQPAVSKEAAYAAVGDRAISRPPPDHNRAMFYLYCRQQGLWPKEVTGHDPDKDPAALDQYCPVRNVTPDYPPTLLLHGDKDTDVPYELSVMMANELDRAGVEHTLVTVTGGGHGFIGADPAVIRDALQQVVPFLDKHVKY